MPLKAGWSWTRLAVVLTVILGLLAGASGLAEKKVPGEMGLALDEAKKLALTNSPVLAQVRAKTEKARWAYAALAGQKINENLSQTFTGQNLEILQEQAAAGERVAKVSEALAVDGLKKQVERGYLEVLRAEEGITIAEAQLKRGQEQARVTRLAVGAGTAARNDLLSAEAQVGMLEVGLSTARRQREIAMINLNRAMGVDQRTPLVLKTRFERPGNLKLEGIDLDEKVAQALTKRLEVVSAKESVKAKEVEMATVAKFYTPEVYKYREIEAALNEARHGVRVQMAEVESQLRVAYLHLLSAAERLPALDKAVEQAGENLRLANLRYQAGAGTRLDVLGAEASLTQNEAQMAQALLDYNQARIGFEQAAGDN